MKKIIEQNLVRISRIEDLEELIGRVHASSNDCIVLSELSDSLDLDGLCIIPTKSVRCFDREFKNVTFYQAALQAWADTSLNTDLLNRISCNLVKDLRLLMDRRETVAIHEEVSDPDVCYVGTIGKVTNAEIFLDRISASGNRLDDSLIVEISKITKVEMATRYLISVGCAAEILARK